MNIYVANLNFEMQDEDLKKFFIPYGEVSSARIIMDKGTDRSRGFGFVEMSDETAAKKAITELDGKVVDGRPIKVNEAKPKPERSFGNGNRGEGSYNNSKSYNQTRY
jgi:RNA recognition motif-containing protein